MYPKNSYWDSQDAIRDMGKEDEIANLIAIINCPIWGTIDKDIRDKVTFAVTRYAEITADKKIEEIEIIEKMNPKYKRMQEDSSIKRDEENTNDLNPNVIT